MNFLLYYLVADSKYFFHSVCLFLELFVVCTPFTYINESLPDKLHLLYKDALNHRSQ